MSVKRQHREALKQSGQAGESRPALKGHTSSFQSTQAGLWHAGDAARHGNNTVTIQEFTPHPYAQEGQEKCM